MATPRKKREDLVGKGSKHPPNAGKGRKFGSKNKLPGELKKYVLYVAEQLEKEGRGLLEWAKENQTEYWTKMYKACLPKEIEGNLSLTSHEQALKQLDDES